MDAHGRLLRTSYRRHYSEVYSWALNVCFYKGAKKVLLLTRYITLMKQKTASIALTNGQRVGVELTNQCVCFAFIVTTYTVSTGKCYL